MIIKRLVIVFIACLGSLLVAQRLFSGSYSPLELSAALRWLLPLALSIVAILLFQLYRTRAQVRQLRRDASAALDRNIQVMAAVRDVVFRADFSGRLVYVNQAWQNLTGMDAAGARGQSVFAGDYLDQVKQGHTAPLETDLRLRDVAGRYRWSHLTARPYLTVESGAVIIGTLQDIQAQQEQAMIQSARLNVLDGLLGRTGMRELTRQLAEAWESVQKDQRVSVLLVDPDKGTLQTLAAPSMPEPYNQALSGIRPGEGAGSFGTAIYRGEPVYVSDVRTDPLWRDFQDLAALGSVVS